MLQIKGQDILLHGRYQGIHKAVWSLGGDVIESIVLIAMLETVDPEASYRDLVERVGIARSFEDSRSLDPYVISELDSNGINGKLQGTYLERAEMWFKKRDGKHIEWEE